MIEDLPVGRWSRLAALTISSAREGVEDVAEFQKRRRRCTRNLFMKALGPNAQQSLEILEKMPLTYLFL